MNRDLRVKKPLLNVVVVEEMWSDVNEEGRREKGRFFRPLGRLVG